MAASLWLSFALPIHAEGIYGSILAGREALNDNDFPAAEVYFARAHAQEPVNLRFAVALLTAEAALGEFE
jgi:hypothetical protein